MTNIGIFCGSARGKNPQYYQMAREFGKMLAIKGYRVVYGAGNIGLMGAVADGAVDAGGEVVGIIPEFMMPKNIHHTGIKQLIVTQDMHERKQKLAELSDVFIALPGGYGTLDEISEMLTFTQLRIFQKPVGLLNSNGYFNALIDFANRMFDEGFMSSWHRSILIDDENPEQLLRKLNLFEVKDKEKWFEDHVHLND